MREEAERKERETLGEDLRRVPLADTAGKQHRPITAPLAQVRSMANMRTGALEDVHELAVSIRETGLLHPPLVRATGEDEQPYELLAGQRRWPRCGSIDEADEPQEWRFTLVDGISRREALSMQFAENFHQSKPEPVHVRPRGAADHGRGPVADRRRGLADRRRPAVLDAQGAAAARAARGDRRARRARRPLVHRRRLRPPRHRQGQGHAPRRPRTRRAARQRRPHAASSSSTASATSRRRPRTTPRSPTRLDAARPRRRRQPPREERDDYEPPPPRHGSAPVHDGPTDAQVDGFVLGAFLYHSRDRAHPQAAADHAARPTRTSTPVRCTRTSACSRCARSRARRSKRVSVTADMAEIDYDAFDALTFDCYGTLIDWERGILAALEPHIPGADQGVPSASRVTRPRWKPARTCPTSRSWRAVCARWGRSSASCRPTSRPASSAPRSPTGPRSTTVRRRRAAQAALQARGHHQLRRRPLRRLQPPPRRRVRLDRHRRAGAWLQAPHRELRVRLRAHRRPARADPARRPEPVPRPRAGQGARDDHGLDRPPSRQVRRRGDAARRRPARRDVRRPASFASAASA